MCRLKAQGRENKKTVKKEEEHEDAMLPHGNIDCFQLVVTGGRSLCVLLPAMRTSSCRFRKLENRIKDNRTRV